MLREMRNGLNMNEFKISKKRLMDCVKDEMLRKFHMTQDSNYREVRRKKSAA